MVNDVIKELQAGFDKALDAFKRDLARVRTGRANIAMLDGVKVEYYGTPTPLNQISTMTVPDARLITIKPWEKSLIPFIEKAIKAQSDLGLNPTTDGELVRIPIPPLTQDRRKELVKTLKKLAEEAKVALRGVRREANENLKAFTDSGDVSEDEERTGLKKIQDATDKHVAMVDEIVGKKEKEILDV